MQIQCKSYDGGAGNGNHNKEIMWFSVRLEMTFQFYKVIRTWHRNCVPGFSWSQLKLVYKA